jgi:uncharacterized membrane protein YqaE (UPF0057 family)
MQRQRPAQDPDEVANLVLSVVLTVLGCWLLAMVAGAVALLAILLTAVVYVPLRVLHLEGRLGAGRRRRAPDRVVAVEAVEALVENVPGASAGAPRVPSPRGAVEDWTVAPGGPS